MPETPATAATAECGCPEFRREMHSTRRTFLKGSAAVAGAAAFETMTGGVFRQLAFGAGGTAANVLVVVSLRGGADGLSMVVPHGDPAYAVARPRIAVPTSALLAKDAMFGLHPAFKPLLPMWQAGTFGAVQAVGLPQPNRSHFAAMEEMEDADPGSAARRGWLNRMVGLDRAASPMEAVQLGQPTVPTALYGPAPVVAGAKLSSIRLASPRNRDAARRHRRSMNMTWGSARGPLGRGARSAMAAATTLRPLTTRTERPRGGADYPKGDLGVALADTARLLRAGIGVEVVSIDYGDWDMHVGLGTVQGGAMRNNVTELATALAAFFTDLGSLASRVTVVTISEFGRRVAENGGRGLDHGFGNAMLLLGAGVRGGQVHGSWPGLGSQRLVSGDLNVTRDYRSVLTEVLRSRFPTTDTSRVFPGFRPETVGTMRL
ncbi:MAG TPA: DUF1501 domain-containing protein [Nocardioidaceae bacterium]|nr:DUF1501 domain-containing protein [Nocardioidaceae bacterium]